MSFARVIPSREVGRSIDPRRELLGVVQELEALREVGVCKVPLIFLMVQGPAPRDLADLNRLGSTSVDMTRTILSMPQPVYGLALGETLVSTRGNGNCNWWRRVFQFLWQF